MIKFKIATTEVKAAVSNAKHIRLDRIFLESVSQHREIDVPTHSFLSGDEVRLSVLSYPEQRENEPI